MDIPEFHCPMGYPFPPYLPPAVTVNASADGQRVRAPAGADRSSKRLEPSPGYGISGRLAH